MSRRWTIVIAAACVINLALIVLGRGSRGQFIVLFLILSIGLLALCIGSLLLLAAKLGWTSPALRRLATRAIIVGGIAWSCLVSVPFGILVSRYDIWQAMSFCDQLHPALDEYKRTTGRYPASVSEVSKGRPPWLLRDGRFYLTSDDQYGFIIMDPAGMLEGVEYDSRSGLWSEFD
jgi:hypothetical protein